MQNLEKLTTVKLQQETVQKYSAHYLKFGVTLDNTWQPNTIIQYFKAYLRSIQDQQTFLKRLAKDGEVTWKAPYQVTFLIQKKEPYTVTEDLVVPAASDMCKMILTWHLM